MGGNKRVLINMVANLVAFGVQFGINFFLTPYIINSLGSESYSFIPLTSNIVGYMNIITVAFYSMTGRFLAVAVGEEDYEKANRYFTSSTIANCALSAVLVIPGLLIALSINHIINIPTSLVDDVRLTFVLSFVNMLISLSCSAYGAVYFATNRLDINARRNIESNIMRALLLVVLFTVFQPKIYFLNATMTFVVLFIVVVNIHNTHKLLPFLHLKRKYFSIGSIKEILSSGIWNSLNQASYVLLGTLDLLLANIFAGSTASGVYAVAKTVPNFVQSIISVILPAFTPYFTLLFAKRKHEELLRNVGYGIRFIGFICAVPIGFLLEFGSEFFHLWVPAQDSALLHNLSSVTLVALALSCAVIVIDNVFTATNKLKVPAYVLFGLGILNVFVALVLIKCSPLGIWAIPFAALFTTIVRSVAFTPWYGAKCLGLPWYALYAPCVRGFVCTITMTVVCVAYRYLTPACDSWLLLIIAGVVCSIIGCLINLFLIFNADERKKVIDLLTWRGKIADPVSCTESFDKGDETR